jgi:hypothetical protein
MLTLGLVVDLYLVCKLTNAQHICIHMHYLAVDLY